MAQPTMEGHIAYEQRGTFIKKKTVLETQLNSAGNRLKVGYYSQTHVLAHHLVCYLATTNLAAAIILSCTVMAQSAGVNV